MRLLVLMAGDSDAFEVAGHTYPKNLVEIDGLPLVQRVVENLSPVLSARAMRSSSCRRTRIAAFTPVT